MKTNNLRKLNAKVKQVWINALVSRKFKQGIGQLKDGGEDGGPASYCCLGVLGECLPRFNEGNDGNYLSYSLLPKAVQDMLAALNDGDDVEALTFGKIAKIVALPNKQLLKLADLYTKSKSDDLESFEHELKQTLRKAALNG